MLLIWPLVAFAAYRALGPARGTLANLIGGYLLLPPWQASFELPILPPLNKDTIPPLTSLVICLTLYRSQVSILPRSLVARVLLGLFVLGPVFTAATNLDWIYDGAVTIQGMSLREVPSLVLWKLALVAPFLLARALFSHVDSQRELLWCIVAATFLYSFPMLVEVRLSPQLNTWIYGFFQHDFQQMMRQGGFRPIVFLYHGLWVALLAAMAILSACVLLRTAEDSQKSVRFGFVALWLFVVLVLCKTLGALIYAVVFAPLILLVPVGMQLRAALLLALLALTYPIARGMDLVPVESLVGLAERISEDRSQSLGYRFGMEEILLEHARERPLFGWGTWGRHYLYDNETGQPITVADGQWIIVLGTWGWAGYLGEFGLLALPILLALWRGVAATPRLTAGAILILSINMADLLLNATITPLTWLIAGAVLGWAERPGEARVRDGPAAAAPRLSAMPPAIPLVLGKEKGQGGVRTLL